MRASDVITVGIADCQVTNNLEKVLVTHALGSCIAVAVHDPVAGVAGLLHIMLPESNIDPERASRQPFMFADTGIPELFHAAYAKGAQKKRMSVRLVGGGRKSWTPTASLTLESEITWRLERFFGPQE